MTNPTLERAARAVATACEQVRPSDEHDAEAWSYIARAVLMAVREPDEAMLEAADKFGMDGDLFWIDGEPKETWRAMIDAILGENDANA